MTDVIEESWALLLDSEVFRYPLNAEKQIVTVSYLVVKGICAMHLCTKKCVYCTVHCVH